MSSNFSPGHAEDTPSDHRDSGPAIDQQASARHAQADTEQRLRRALEAAEIGIWDFNP